MRRFLGWQLVEKSVPLGEDEQPAERAQNCTCRFTEVNRLWFAGSGLVGENAAP
jgi:hypothetical protein